MDAPPTLGGRLRLARKLKHLTQEAVGELLNLTHATVGQWERDLTMPTLENLVSAAEHYEASLDWLIWGGDMASGIENRVRKIHPALRLGLVQRLHKEIDETEQAARRLPVEMLAAPVKDKDERLKKWSAKDKIKKAKESGGTQ